MKPFKETKAFEIIKRVAPHLLKEIDKLPGGSIISSIIESITTEKLPVTPEEMAVLQSFEKEMYALELESVKSAQAMNVALNQSEHASWLAKNTPSIIALSYTTFNFVIYVMILGGWMKTDNDIAILIVNSITNIAMLIVGYYYGSSNRTQNLRGKITGKIG